VREKLVREKEVRNRVDLMYFLV